MGKFLNSLLKGIADALTSDDHDNYDLSSYSYDELDEQREEVRMHPQNYKGDDWKRELNRYDRAMADASRPHRDYCKTLSDEELSNEKAQAWNEYDELNKKFIKDKRPYEELYKDPEYKESNKKYRKYEDLMLEEQRRNAEKNPGKFPRHREHGWYLPNDDD